MDSDSDDEYCFVKPFKIEYKTKAWDSAHIKPKQEGKWLVFYDEKTGERLNDPPPISKGDNGKAYYKRKIPKERKIQEIQPFEPPTDNYTAIKPRRHFVLKQRHIDTEDKYKNIIDDDLSQMPEHAGEHYFVGNRHYRNPFRVSTYLVNEKRAQEMKEILEEGYRKRAPKTARRNLPSRFERSVSIPKKFEL